MLSLLFLDLQFFLLQPLDLLLDLRDPILGKALLPVVFIDKLFYGNFTVSVFVHDLEDLLGYSGVNLASCQLPQIVHHLIQGDLSVPARVNLRKFCHKLINNALIFALPLKVCLRYYL